MRICKYEGCNVIVPKKHCYCEEHKKIMRKLNVRKYREKHNDDDVYKSKTKQQMKTWRENNPDKVKEQKITYYNRHKDSILLTAKTYRDANKEKIAKYQVKRQKDIQGLLNNIKLSYGCMNPQCKWDGEFNPLCLEFHHVNPKDKSFNISQFNKVSLSKISNEIKKCTILCANCHRVITWGSSFDGELLLVTEDFYQLFRKLSYKKYANKN